MPDLRIFISSPGDVPDERLRAELVIEKLSQDYRRFFTLSTYRWEHEPMLASGHFQDAIEEPSRYDVFLLIVWSRLGTPLPEQTAVRPYRGIDGRAPVTGTEWEFEDALAAARASGTPKILAFRNTSPAPIDTYDPAARARSLAQLDALDAFWRRHFADQGTFIGAFEGYRDLGEFARILEQKLRKLIDRLVATTEVAPHAAGPLWIGAPFRGLQAYEFEHAAIFFGRDAMVARAARHLALAARHNDAFLLVAGASGSGKSSLVKAALVPRLMKPQRIEGLAFLRRVLFRPSDAEGDLVTGLVEAFVRDRRRDGIGLPELLGPGQTAADLAKHLRAVPESPGFVFSGGLARVTEDARKTGHILPHEQARAILVVDQLEELFTREMISDDERTRFVQLLSGLAKSGLVWVVATMRSDFWHRTADVPLLLALAAGERRLDVAAPSPLELADMIRRPAEAAGLSFEDDRETGVGLDAELARRAAAEPGVLPLLSFTLDALFQEDVVAKHGRVLTYATYESLGGLEGAIANRAEAIISALPERAQRAVPRVLRALITVSDGVDAIAVARAAPLDMFAPGTDARTVVDALTAGRLLVATGGGGHASVRVAHGALIGRWKRAEEQVARDRRDLETRKLVERQYERWNAAHDADLLLRDPDLTNAGTLEARWGEDLEAEHRAFIQRSLDAARSAARRRWIVAGIVMVALAALTALSIGGLAIAAMQRDAALVAQSRALARDAGAALDQGDPTLAMLLALAALPRSLEKSDRPFVLDAEYALANAFANRRERAILHHSSKVAAIAYAPDGKRLAVVSDKDGIVWNVETGREIVSLEPVAGRLMSIEFSHDGRHLAGGADTGTAYVWDATTGKIIARLTGHGGPVASASFSKDDTLIVTASDRAGIFDARTGKRLQTIAVAPATVVAAIFSPDGKEIATASDDGIARLWTREGVILHSYPRQGAELTAIAFSTDGQRLASATDSGSAVIWETGGSYAQVSQLVGHAARINTISFSPDGAELLTASDDHSARIWSTATGIAGPPLIGHTGAVYSAAFSRDGKRIVTASDDRTARIWDARNGFLMAVLGGNGAPVVAALFAPDGGSLATAAREPVARLWNSEASASVAVMPGGKGLAVGAFSPDGTRIATGSEDGILRIWDGRTGAPVATWGGQKGTIRSVAFAPDGRTIVTASADGIARLWRVADGAVRTLEGEGAAINAARFSPDGRWVATASDDSRARIWDPATRAIVHTFVAKDRLTDAAFDAGGQRIVTTSSDGTTAVWDVATGAHLADLPARSTFATSAIFSPDGTRIATATGRAAGLWDGRAYGSVASLSSGGTPVTSVAFAADGASLATAAFDKTARLWDAREGASLRLLVGHRLAVRSVAFAPDGTRLVTTSDDRTSRYWDAATGKTMAVFAGDEASVRSGVFAPDSDLILTASDDSTARLWAPPPFCQALIDKAHSALPRDLTDAERKHYFLEVRTRGWMDEVYDVASPLFALVLPHTGDRCR